MAFQKMVKYIKRKQNSSKILFMGLDNAGKTTILNMLFKLGSECAPTFGYKIHSVEYKNSKNLKNSFLSILDIGGQSCFKSFWNSYFESTDGIVFIVDCTDKRSFCPYLNDLLELKVPICVMINKTDINPGFITEFKINEKLINSENVKCFATSAYCYEKLDEGMQWLMDRIDK